MFPTYLKKYLLLIAPTRDRSRRLVVRKTRTKVGCEFNIVINSSGETVLSDIISDLVYIPAEKYLSLKTVATRRVDVLVGIIMLYYRRL